MTWRVLRLTTRRPFVIARAAATAYDHVFVEVTDGEFAGHGEASPSEFYGEDTASVDRALATLAGALGDDPLLLESTALGPRALRPDDAAARAAVDMALHDLAARELGLPLHRLLGFPAGPLPATSMTVGIAEPSEMEERVLEASAFRVLKIKVGWEGDVEFVSRVRRLTSQAIRVDANGAWSAPTAKERVRALHERCGVELVEQPCAATDLAGMEEVAASSPVPIFADESCRAIADLAALAGRVHGVNVKLAKCGGLREAMAMIHLARAAGMQVMMGCMVESSLAVTAAAHLSAAADLVDLDGHLLLDQDPYRGVELVAGVPVLPQTPGIGAAPR